MAVDGGKIRISTEIDLKGFYKDLKELNKAAPTEINIDFSKMNTGDLYQQMVKTFDSIKSYYEKSKIDVLSENDIIRAQRLQAVAGKIAEEIHNRTGKYVNLFKDEELENDKQDLEEIKEKVEEINKKTSSLTNLKSIGNSIKGITRQVTRWALAVFGVQGAYNLLRNSMNVISQYDDQLAADIEYMKNAIAFALEPVVRAIVNLMKQLMQYVGYIVKAWFGINIFENANKSLEKSNKEAKKLSKTLASFDEMNVLQDTSSGASSGTTTPSFSLTSPEDVQPPSWLTWIIDHKGEILATLGGIAGFLGAIKLGIGGIQALGIGGIIAGVILLIRNLIKYFDKLDGSLENNGTSWEDFGGILKGISLILIGVGILTGQVEIAIAGLILLLVSIIMENWTDIKNWWNNDVQPKIDEKLNWIRDKFGWFGEVIYGRVTAIRDWIVDRFTGMFLPIKNIFDGILLFIKGDWQNGLKNVMKGLLNWIIGKLNILIDGLNLFLTPLRATIVTIGKVTGKKVSMDNIKIPRIPYLAKGGIINMPSKGVMVGQAIAGESGREGVLPLTDSQAMEQLGATIGRYITINANITNTMNGRVISRELQKINNENDFAFNR